METVKSKDGRVVRIGDRIIIKGNSGYNVEGVIAKIEPTPSGHQLFMVTGRVRKYQYYSRNSYCTQVFRFSLDNCTWKKDISQYTRKPVQKEYRDRSSESVRSCQGASKKHQKKKPPSYIAKHTNFNWDDITLDKARGVRSVSTPFIPYVCEPVEVDVDDVGEVTFESMCLSPRGRYQKRGGEKEPKTNNYVFSPGNNTSNNDNGNINSKKEFEEKVRTERKQNMAYQEFLEKEILGIKAKGNQPRTFIKYM